MINLLENYSCSLNNKIIQKYNACSISDVYKILNDIVENVFNKSGYITGKPLWFRGQDKEKYTLIPSLYRNRDNEGNKTGSYSMVSLAEEYRHQNFSARVNHLAHAGLGNRTEWQEVLQHHFGKTRFMDWSESVKTALDFALEPFIDTKDTIDNRIKRSNITPGIWVLNPYKLNEYVYDFFANGDTGLKLIRTALRNLYNNSTEISEMGEKIQKELKENKRIYFNFSDNIDITINGLVSISVLDKYYHYNAAYMEKMLESFEFNPFFYLLIRYYADALPVEAGVNKTLLPPVASVQPYHSERIRAQRGAFTIFPNYIRAPEAMQFKGTKMDVVSIEAQKDIADSFCYIRLCNPVKIAKELIYAGERLPEVYPDIQRYADYLETQKVYV